MHFMENQTTQYLQIMSWLVGVDMAVHTVVAMEVEVVAEAEQ
jgi:hypothetical protein